MRMLVWLAATYEFEMKQIWNFVNLLCGRPVGRSVRLACPSVRLSRVRP